MRRKGFTLIELLVVIAIMAILAAVLFPVFARARGQARQSACLSNAKQIALAVSMYAQDHDETLVLRYIDPDPVAKRARIWKDSIEPYLKSAAIYRCPSNPRARTPDSIGKYPGGYAMWLPDGPIAAVMPELMPGAAYPQPMAGIASPANALLVLEHSYHWTDTGPYLQYNEPAKDQYALPGPSEWNSGHDKKACNIVYLDGHARWSPLLGTFDRRQADGTNEWRFNPDTMYKKLPWMSTLEDGLRGSRG
jgi:prepilin-type N-terminal cleavage/methylation domain-containing protein/prepilin-type processing-associated H-X9-DG protein